VNGNYGGPAPSADKHPHRYILRYCPACHCRLPAVSGTGSAALYGFVLTRFGAALLDTARSTANIRPLNASRRRDWRLPMPRPAGKPAVK